MRHLVRARDLDLDVLTYTYVGQWNQDYYLAKRFNKETWPVEYVHISKGHIRYFRMCEKYSGLSLVYTERLK